MFKHYFIAHLFGGSPDLSAIKILELVHPKERVLVKNLPANSTEGSVRQLFETYAALGGGGDGVSPLVEWLAFPGSPGASWGFHMVLKEKPHHWWSLINKLRWNFSIPPWEETVAFRTAMLNCTAYDMPSFWSGLVLLNTYFRTFHSYVRIPWTNSTHFTCLHCESGFSMLFIGHQHKTSLLTCWWNPCPSHTHSVFFLTSMMFCAYHYCRYSDVATRTWKAWLGCLHHL